MTSACIRRSSTICRGRPFSSRMSNSRQPRPYSRFRSAMNQLWSPGSASDAVGTNTTLADANGFPSRSCSASRCVWLCSPVEVSRSFTRRANHHRRIRAIPPRRAAGATNVCDTVVTSSARPRDMGAAASGACAAAYVPWRMMTTVLLVEDDPAAREGLELALRRLGYGVRSAVTGEAALDGLSGAAADVVVLDVMLPGLDGLEVCRRLRRRSEVPVIMLTARGGDLDIVGGLEAGAAGYVGKPVEPRVLDARIRAVLRRIDRPGSPVETHGELVIDRASLIVRRAGREGSLTPTELRLLLVLSGSPRQVFSREQLLGLVWEHDYLGDSRLVDACVQRLRAKIEADPAGPRYVQTVRGFGYRFGPV